jgi:outer membrane protein TolC
MQNEQPAGTLRLTMKEAVSRALAQNPQVQIANLNVAISQAEGTISRSALLPQASFEVSQLVRKINTATSFGREFSLIPKGIGPFPVIQMGPVASVPLFDLTLWKRWRIAQQNVNVSRAQESVVREQTVLLTVSQYLSGMRAAASVKAAQSRVDLAKAIFDQATNLQQAGAGTGIDTLRANVELQAEKQRLIVASTQLETSLFALSKLLNLPTEQRIELGDELRYEPASAPEPAPIAVAYNQRPDLQTVIERLKTANLRKDLTRAEWLPKVSFNGAWTPAGVHYTDMIPTYQYEVSLSVPIFTAGRIRAEQKRAALDLERTQKDEQDTKNQIAQEAKTSRAELESAIQEVEVSNLGIQLAQEEVVQARDRFQAGVANTVEVVTAQDRLARANDDQISALYRYNQARADLARAYGQLQSTYAK